MGNRWARGISLGRSWHVKYMKFTQVGYCQSDLYLALSWHVSSYLADVVNMDTSGLAALEELHKELACLGIQVSVTNMLRFPTYV